MSDITLVPRPRRWLRRLVGCLLFVSGFVTGFIVLVAFQYHQFSEPCPVAFQPMPGDQLGVGGGPGFIPPHTIDHPLKFPPAARTAFLQGGVVMLAYVQADGHVAQAHVMRSSGFCPFDAEAQRAVPKWRFTPATRNGTPIATWWIVNVEFRLNRAGTPGNAPVLRPLPVRAPGAKLPGRET